MKTLTNLISKVSETQAINPKPNIDGARLVNFIDDGIASRHIRTEVKQVDGFHPSNTNQCGRYQVYTFRGIEVTPDFTSRTIRIFDNGHAMHARIGRYLDEMGILVASEIPISLEDPPIRGSADGIIDFDGPKVIELKSIADSGFVMRMTYSKPKDDHYRQIQLYMHGLDIHSGFVIYENKNDQNLLALPVEYDEVFITKLLKKYAKIYTMYQDGDLPKRPYKITSNKCKWCAVKDYCWNDLDDGK